MSQSWFEESLNAMATASTNNPQTSMSPYPRRKRPINSCTECRRRKAGCSKSYPCTNCIKFSRHCVFDPHGRSTDQDLFKHAAPGRTASDDESYAASPSWSAESGQSEHSQDTSNVQGTPAMNEEGQLSSNDGRHNVGKLEMDNFCLHVGKLSLNGRIGGALRPKITSIIEGALSRGQLIHQRHHQSPTKSFSAPVVAWFKPCPLLPLVSFFGTGPVSDSVTMENSYFPIKNECQYLCQQYFCAADPFAHLLSKTTFKLTVDHLYDQTLPGALTLDSTKALVLAVCFAAAVSLPFLQCQRHLGAAKSALVERYKLATEHYLRQANVLNSSNLETIQAAVIYLIPMCRGEVSRSSSIFVGALIRNAQIAGFDEDHPGASMNLLSNQSRRLLWCQLCFLDLRTAEAQGPRPAIQPTSVGTTLPWNANDWELNARCPALASETGLTDSTFSLIRYECYEVHRQILRHQEEIRAGRETLSYASYTVDESKRRIEEVYLEKLDEEIPLQRCAKLVGKLLLARFDLMLLHEHLPKIDRSASHLHLRNRLVRSSLDIVESAATLETDPQLAPWAWYASAYQQYHSLIFLLIELYQEPDLEEAGRICAIADYVFGSSFGVSAGQRSGEILRVLKENLALLPSTKWTSLDTQQPTFTSDIPPQEPVESGSVDESVVWNEWDIQGAVYQPESNNPDYSFGEDYDFERLDWEQDTSRSRSNMPFPPGWGNNGECALQSPNLRRGYLLEKVGQLVESVRGPSAKLKALRRLLVWCPRESCKRYSLGVDMQGHRHSSFLA